MAEVSSQTLHIVARELAAELNEARAALETFGEQQDNLPLLRKCAEHLHSVHGALRVAEVYGAALLAEEMGQVTRYLIDNFAEKRHLAEGLDALMRAMVQLPTYLERVLSGGRDMALVLLPLLNDLRAVRGHALLSEGTLLLLNLSSDQPANPVPPAPGESGLTVAQWARKLRTRFQLGLLGWIKGERVDQNLEILSRVAEKMEQVATTQPLFQLWWVVGAVLEALREGGLEGTASVKRLLGQADRDLKRLYEQGEARYADSPSLELLNNLLYYVARARTSGPRVTAVRASFRLAELLPVDDHVEQARESLSAPSVKLMKTVAAAIKEDLSRVKDALDIFVRQGGTQVEELAPQLDLLKKIADTLGVLGLGELRDKVQGETSDLQAIIAKSSAASGAQREPVDETALLRMAATLIKVEDSLDEQLVGMIVPTDEPQAKPATSDDVEFRQVTEAVLRECIVNMARIKEAIALSMEKPREAQAIEQIPQLVRGITAGLMMLNKPRVVEVMEGIDKALQQFLRSDGLTLPPEAVDRLADAIVAVEYYMETLQAGRADPWYMLDNAEACLRYLADTQLVPRLDDSVAGDHARTLVIEPSADTQTVAAPTEHERTAVLDRHSAVTQTATVVAVPETAAAPAPAPTAAPPAIAATDREIDPEFLELFIEEAKDEIAKLQQFFPRWDENPQDVDSLTNVRRSFHTLKGSGRMVGAQLIGEFAWAIENMLNRVINKTLERTPDIMALMREAVAAVPELVEQLETGRDPRIDVVKIITQAHTLAGGKPAGAPVPGASASYATPQRASAAQPAAAQPAAKPEPPTLTSTSIVEPIAVQPQPVAPAETAEKKTESAEPLAPTAEEPPKPAAPDMDPVLHEIYAKETAGHLAVIREFIANCGLIGAPYPVTEDLYRSCHTLSGTAKTAGARHGIKIAEPLNRYIRKLYDNNVALSDRGLAVLQDAVNAIQQVIDRIDADTGFFASHDHIVARLNELDHELDAEISRLAETLDVGLAMQSSGEEGTVEAPAIREDIGGATNVFDPQAFPAPATPAANAATEAADDVIELDPMDPNALDLLNWSFENLPQEGDAEKAQDDSAAPAAESAAEEIVLDEFSVDVPLDEPAAPEPTVTHRALQVPELNDVASPATVSVPVLTDEPPTEPVLLEPDDDAQTKKSLTFAAVDNESLPAVDEDMLARAFADMPPEEASTEPTNVHPALTSLEASADTAEPVADSAPEAAEEPEEIVLESALEEENVAVEPESADVEGVASDASDDASIEVEEIELETPQLESEPSEVPQVEELPHAEEVEFAAPEVDESVQVIEPESEAALEAAEPQPEVASQPVIAAEPAPVASTPAPDQPAAPAPAAVPVVDDAVDVDDDFDPDVAAIFTEEATELLETADSSLNAWLRDRNNNSLVFELKRVVHTLKGGARMAGLRAMGDLSHELETLMGLVEAGQVPAEPQVFEVLQASLDELNSMRDVVASGGRCKQAKHLLARIRALSGTGPAVEEPAPAPAPTPAPAPVEEPIAAPPTAEVEVELGAEEDEAPTASVPVLTEDAIAELEQAPVASAEPEAVVAVEGEQDEIEVEFGADELGAAAPRASLGLEDSQKITVEPPQTALDVAAITPELPPDTAAEPVVEPQPAPALPPGREPVAQERQEFARVDAELLDTLLNNAGEVSIFRSRLEQQVSSIEFNLAELGRTVTRLKEQLRKIELETEAQILHRHQEEHPGRADFDPLELDRYSTIQQLTRAFAESVSDVGSIEGLLENLTREAQNLLLQQSRVVTELQNGLMRTRMVPFQRHVQRLSRLVRQVASETGKKAELVVTGASGELDRQVLERMLPPFEHMLRNSVVHGIETPEERAARGKPESGTIKVGLHREGSEMVIVLEDDGRGIDVNAVRERAKQRGLLQPGKVLTDEEALQLIMEPGFSTAEKLTQHAGRGVGMDVVVTEIKKLGGVLFTESVFGQGVKFTIRLPFTLAITQALIVRTGEELYALPLPSVEGVARIPRSEVQKHLAEETPTFNYGGQIYRFQHLGAFVGGGPSVLPEADVAVPLVLIRAGEHSTALVTDELVGSREMVVKSVGPQLSAIRGIAGATILGDGRIVIILDMGALVRSEWRSRPQLDASATVDRRVFALVVDDSITVRRVTQRLLERHGMCVMTAKDGVDALSILQEHTPDVILLDIEMPRMDGYEFATQVRADPRFADIPIVMITSRVGEKHRARAIEIGVNDYLGKPYQEHQLLDAIEPLVEARRKKVAS
jgi:chemosensory pili system protein ChpA (sensor histidine kinase/response regulator)